MKYQFSSKRDTPNVQQTRPQKSAPPKKQDTDHNIHPRMTNAEVKQWYIDAEREYEEKKKVGTDVSLSHSIPRNSDY